MKKQFLYILVTVILTSCGEPTINGKLVDVFNQPISNADVSIKGTSITTKTNSNGEYSINFVAGNDINLQFKKENYIDTTLVVSILEKKNFPAEITKTYKIPEKEGLYIMDNNYFQLSHSKIKTEISTFKKKGYANGTYTYTRKTHYAELPDDKVIKVKSGIINIFSNFPLGFRINKITKEKGSSYKIGYSQSHLLGYQKLVWDKTNTFKNQKYEYKKLNKSNSVRTINLGSGYYALTNIGEKNAYIFQVE